MHLLPYSAFLSEKERTKGRVRLSHHIYIFSSVISVFIVIAISQGGNLYKKFFMESKSYCHIFYIERISFFLDGLFSCQSIREYLSEMRSRCLIFFIFSRKKKVQSNASRLLSKKLKACIFLAFCPLSLLILFH